MSKKRTKISRWLPVALTETEILERSRTMSERCKEKQKIEAEKAAVVRDFGEKLKKLSGEISRLSEIVSSGEEQRTVDCHEEIRGNRVVLIREDTGAVVSDRPATEEEKQEKLWGGE